MAQRSVDKPFEDFVGHTEQRYRSITLWVPTDFVGLGIATTSALLQILGILSRRKQEEMKSRNQDFKAAPAWSISSEQMESGPGALHSFKCWKVAANSLCEKLSKIFTASGVVALQWTDTS